MPEEVHAADESRSAYDARDSGDADQSSNTLRAVFHGPSGTTLRFITLIALIAATTSLLYGTIGSTWRVGLRLPSAVCQVRSGFYLAQASAGFESPAQLAGDARYDACMGLDAFRPLRWVGVALAVLALVALLLDAARPRLLILRRRLVPIGRLEDRDGRIAAELSALVELAALRRAPRFLVDPINRHADGLALGGVRYRAVCLNAGLIALLERDPRAFRGIVLHELAHLRNRDVGLVSLTVALWRAYVLVTVVPWLLVFLDPALTTADPWSSPFGRTGTAWDGRVEFAAPALLWAAVIVLSRNAVLRARERYADARAALWLAPSAPDGSTAWLPVGGPAATARWWHTHPSLSARLRTLRAPYLLLRPGFWETAAAATAVGLAWTYIQNAQALLDLSADSPTVLAERWVCAILVALLVTVSAWLAAAYRRAGGTERGLAVRFGLAVGVGLIGGSVLPGTAPGGEGIAAPSVQATPTALAVDAATILAWSAVACAAAYYARMPARGTWLRRAGLAGAFLLSLAVMEGWNFLPALNDLPDLFSGTPRMLSGYAARAQARGWGTAMEEAVVYPFIVDHLEMTFTVVAVTLLWLPPWAVGAIEPGARRRAATVGICAGLLGIAAAVGAHLWSAGALAPSTRGAGTSAILLGSAEVWGLVAIDLAAAIILGARRAGLPAALFASFLATAVAAAALDLGRITAGLWPGRFAVGPPGDNDLTFTSRVVSVLVLGGVAATLIGYPLGAGLRGFNRAPATAATAVCEPPPARRSLPVLALAAVLIFSVVHLARASNTLPLLAAQPTAAMSGPAADRADSLAWLEGGGAAQLSGFVVPGFRVADDLTTLANQPGQPAAEAALRSDCRDLITGAAAAGRFPAPPTQPLLDDWRAMLAAEPAAVGVCRQALTAGDAGLDTTAVRSGLERMQTTAAPKAAMIAEIARLLNG